MAAGKRRVEPLQQSDTRPLLESGRAGDHRLDASGQSSDNFLRDPLYTCSFRHLADGGEDLREGLRFQVDHAGSAGEHTSSGSNLILGHRANVAQRLRDDQVGP
jgi:hypothetical protein